MARSAVVVGVGARAGLGGALCRRFASEGLHVLVVGRSADKLEAVAGEIHGAGGVATPLAADATSPEDVRRIFDTAERTGGVPGLVVYNAGNNRVRPLLEMDDAFFEDAWRTCCFGGFLVGREAARRMLSAGGGTLIFTGATASLRARPPFTAFAAAKAALRALAQGMAREFGPQGLHVGHVVIDGGIAGEQLLSRFPQLAEQRGEDGLLAPEAIAAAYWQLHLQPRSAWSFEFDLRPWREPF
jgi:NAD(P)-dependent dehydrogenase (short-subunit alcohol dehydrogenase family)